MLDVMLLLFNLMYLSITFQGGSKLQDCQETEGIGEYITLFTNFDP